MPMHELQELIYAFAHSITEISPMVLMIAVPVLIILICGIVTGLVTAFTASHEHHTPYGDQHSPFESH